MKPKTLLFVILICICNFLSSEIIKKSGKRRPIWISKTPIGEKFFYYTGIGSSDKTLEDAKQLAISDVVSEIIKEGKITVSGSTYSKTGEYEENSQSKTISEIVEEVTIKGESQKIVGLKTEEFYWQEEENNGSTQFRYWILMRLPKNIKDINYQIKQTYGIAPVLRSTLIPGWGQFYKKETKKGFLFLSSEAVLIGTALFSNFLSIQYNDKALKETNITTRTDYMNWSDSAETIAITSGIAAGVIHIYNIFDSITSKGAKRYAINKKNTEIFVSLDQELLLINIKTKW